MLFTAPTPVVGRGPLVFLAGPVIWGPLEWHDRATALLEAAIPGVLIASPRRDQDTSARLWNPQEDASGADEFPEAAYNEQQDWETLSLRRAAHHGVVMFWLARETEHRCERPHAQTTRFELGEWKERHARDGVNLVVGIEPDFTGGRYVQRRFAQDCPAVPICSTLEDTCRATAALCGSLGQIL